MEQRSHGLEVCVSGLVEPEEAAAEEEEATERLLLDSQLAKEHLEAAKEKAGDHAAAVKEKAGKAAAAAKAKAASVYKRMMEHVQKMKRTTKCDTFPSNASLFSGQLGGSYDVFRLGTLFHVHGISLDEPAPGQLRTRREAGSCFILTIHYWNAEPWVHFLKAFWEPLPVKYKYHLTEIPVSEFYVRDAYYGEGWGAAKRVTVEKYGIRMIVMMTGEVGSWSFVALLMLCAAASTTIFMVEKVVYFGVKFWPFEGVLEDDQNGEKVDFRGAFVEEFPKVTAEWYNRSTYTALPTTVVAPAPEPKDDVADLKKALEAQSKDLANIQKELSVLHYRTTVAPAAAKK
jgi:hypothetical protein